MIRHSIDNDKSETWTQRIAWTALIGIVIGGISWAAWITVEMNTKTTAVEAIEMAPYNHDKVWIHRSIENQQIALNELVHKIEGKFSDAMSANTEAIIQLKEQMKYHNKILETLLNALKDDNNKIKLE